jgi:hypothetical protein
MWQGKYDRILPSVRSEIALLSKTGTERLTLTPLLLPPLEVSDERTA